MGIEDCMYDVVNSKDVVRPTVQRFLTLPMVTFVGLRVMANSIRRKYLEEVSVTVVLYLLFSLCMVRFRHH